MTLRMPTPLISQKYNSNANTVIVRNSDLQKTNHVTTVPIAN